MQGETAPESETPILKECILRDGEEFCRTVSPDGMASAPAEVAADTDYLAWARPFLNDPVGWANENVLNLDILVPLSIQVGSVLLALVVGVLLAPPIRKQVLGLLERLPENIAKNVTESVPALVRPALWALFVYLALTILNTIGQESALVRIATSLALAWLLIRVVTTFLPEFVRKPLEWTIWVFAVFYAFGVLDEVLDWLSNVGPPYAGGRISPIFIVQAIATAAFFLFIANWIASRLKRRVHALPRVEPSLRILMSNAMQIGLFFGAALLTLAGLGIPLSGLAVLGGAIGVGLGFGMQQIVANFISGVILLTDRSIKPNDVIEVDDTYGVVKSLGLRYASVITRDGKEHLIPNEMLITDKVVNWSYSNKEVRVKKRLRVEYETDLRQAVDLVVEGAKDTPRVLHSPAPVCLVMEFGDEAIELEARFWINDPENGVANIASQVLLSIWDRFREAGIDIPLRHEDILITPGSTLQVEMVRPKKPSSD
ncbi:mechanosensitive ion channel family protein [Henriciella pelagia]|jgi:small-conductance mechanosensitive channel|uniref:Mechanosensitive ion channel protein n=1 Tax=Henriciella pelagia TaxID=1977912 RepID=A0ABQ1JSJ4_9PROT|nr:mechanosensitive ion channel domain-containing protein [Henriciella pelagia]GGB76515.1 mechanosensitive ion channel protein [Henriciella pelagia]